MAISALPNFSIGLFLPILMRSWALAEVTARNARNANKIIFFIFLNFVLHSSLNPAVLSLPPEYPLQSPGCR